MNIVAIVGSPRAKGNTSFLVDQALAEAKKLGIETEKILLSHYRIVPCLGHDDCGAIGPKCKMKDDLNVLAEKFRMADSIILASPVYHWNVSGQMKVFFDRTRFMRQTNVKLEAKCAGIIAIAANTGMDETLAVLKRFVQNRGKVPPDMVFTLGGRARNLGDAQNNAALVEEARQLGRQMAEKLKSLA